MQVRYVDSTVDRASPSLVWVGHLIASM